MPQMVPFFFVNEVFFAFTALVIMIYISSKYILPKFIRTYLSRLYISKI